MHAGQSLNRYNLYAGRLGKIHQKTKQEPPEPSDLTGRYWR